MLAPFTVGQEVSRILNLLVGKVISFFRIGIESLFTLSWDLIRRMRFIPLIVCLTLMAMAAASVTAAPWSRFKTSTVSKNSRQEASSSPFLEERELGPYLIRSEFPLRDVHELVQDLGELQQDLEETLRLECQPRAIQIHLFQSKRSYDDYLRIRVPEGVNRQALYVPGTRMLCCIRPFPMFRSGLTRVWPNTLKFLRHCGRKIILIAKNYAMPFATSGGVPISRGWKANAS